MLKTSLILACAVAMPLASQQTQQLIVLHAARLLQVDSGTILQPGEILVEGDRIKAVGTSVDHPATRA